MPVVDVRGEWIMYSHLALFIHSDSWKTEAENIQGFFLSHTITPLFGCNLIFDAHI